MGIDKIFSYLVAPGKNDPQPPDVSAVEIPLKGKLFQMLTGVYQSASDECDTPIHFLPTDGEQINEVRSALLDYVKSPELKKGKVLATRLRNCTTHRSGLGLLFLCTGTEFRTKKVVLSRFPAVKAVLAEQDADSLKVEFHEKVFLKSAYTYKAALYQGISFDADFWNGYITDKQMNDPRIADYWMRDFLDSDLITTAKEGSKRFARTLRTAMKKVESPSAKLELAYLATNTSKLKDQRVSINSILDKFDIGEESRFAMLDTLPSTAMAEDTFSFDLEEFEKHARYRADELDTGGIIMAPASKFDEIVDREELDKKQGRYRYTLEGKVVDERISSRKA